MIKGERVTIAGNSTTLIFEGVLCRKCWTMFQLSRTEQDRWLDNDHSLRCASCGETSKVSPQTIAVAKLFSPLSVLPARNPSQTQRPLL